MKHSILALGGTFDHFHSGHQAFITYAAEHGEHLIIGITDENMTQSKLWPQTLESVAVRRQAVENFCADHQIDAELPILHDVFGPTLVPTVTGLCVTEETRNGADRINQERQRLGLSTLPIIICPLVADAHGQLIHSDRIRAGEIDRTGFSYHHLLGQRLVLTDVHRQFFSQPQGSLIDLSQVPTPSSTLTIVVGDTSLETFLAASWPYDIGVFDFYRQRQQNLSPILARLPAIETVINPAGELSLALNQKLIQLTRQKQATPQHLQVEGEEDLAAVAAVLAAPLESKIYYGQPNQGIVCITVTEKVKHVVAHQLTSVANDEKTQ